MPIENSKVISRSYVTLFENPWLDLTIENQFAMNLFDDPQRTRGSITNNGFVIVNTGTIPEESVLIAPDKIQIVKRELNTFIEVVDRIAEYLNEKEHDFTTKSFGLNIDLEFTLPDVDNATQWIAERLISDHARLPDTEITAKSIQFRITPFEDGHLELRIEPRANIPNRIFASSNEHHEIVGEGLLSGDNLTDGFNVAEENLIRILNQLLDGE